MYYFLILYLHPIAIFSSTPCKYSLKSFCLFSVVIRATLLMPFTCGQSHIELHYFFSFVGLLNCEKYMSIAFNMFFLRWVCHFLHSIASRMSELKTMAFRATKILSAVGVDISVELAFRVTNILSTVSVAITLNLCFPSTV